MLMLKIGLEVLINEYNEINLNEMRGKNMQDDGFFNISRDSNHDVDNDIVSIDSQMNSMEVMIMMIKY